MYKKLQKGALFLILGGAIMTASAQTVFKVGNNPFAISNPATVLELESTNKGFMLPRMTTAQRDAIVSPPLGLQVWCTDSNTANTPPTAELCVYLDYGWAPVAVVRDAKLSTGKKSDPNAPVMASPTSVTINGVLISTIGITPTETGVVWKEITGTDYSTLPLLDRNAVATAPVYKTLGTLVTTAGAAISVTIPSLTSTTSSTRPYYFRTYAKSTSGVGYGNTVIFNCAPPVISMPVVTNGSSFTPTFAGTLTVNAGTPQGTITEYGYCSSITNNPPTTGDTKVVLSTTTSLAMLNTTLNSETFTVDPTVDLSVNNYVPTVSPVTTYFRYYVVANGTPVYSPVTTFTPVADLVTGGLAVATVIGVDAISTAPKIGVASSSTINVRFNVTRPGTYAAFTLSGTTGSTTGLTIPTLPAGTFAVGTQTLTFSVTGTPGYALDGNSFAISRLATPLLTGTITDADPTGNAICDGTTPTILSTFSSPSGRVWMDRNLGASRKANAMNDFMAYGCFYQWGRGNDGHASFTWTSSTAGTAVNSNTPNQYTTDAGGPNYVGGSNKDWRSPQNNFLWQGVNGINNPCPVSFRLPTDSEFTTEINAYSINNYTAAFNSDFKIAIAGYRVRLLSGGINGTGLRSYNWTSTLNSSAGLGRFINSTSTSSGSFDRSEGLSVRCIKD